MRLALFTLQRRPCPFLYFLATLFTALLLVIDRSASIGTREYTNARATARDFARKFQVSPSGVNVLIAQFDVNVEVILQFFQGVSYVRFLCSLL